jgi:methylmalonyl-CoA mutase C-terminal domain/subunit
MKGNSKKIRILMAKPGLDSHDRGMNIVSRALMNAGLEVIYLSLQQTVDHIVAAATQEDADVIGLSILSGAHMRLCQKLFDRLKSEGISQMLVVVGGIIPQKDIPILKKMGVAEVFLPGTPEGEIVNFIRRHARRAGR